MNKKITRRTALLRTIQIPVGGMLLLKIGACEGQDEAGLEDDGAGIRGVICTDPNQISEGEKSMRASLNYTSTSSNSQEVCAGCAYFGNSAEPSGGCGPCDILQGQVSSQGHCDSWSIRS